MKTYDVSHTVKITYTHRVQADTAKEAELIAEDLGDINANDGVTGTDWKAKLVRKEELNERSMG